MTVANELAEHRVALTGHCYRMLGSVIDADDAVQEAYLRAVRALDRFEGRASIRTWLTRIATNVCLDMLANRPKRLRPVDHGRAGRAGDPLDTHAAEHWIEPVADRSVLPEDADPAASLILRQSIRLAFVAALQHLPPRQRATLLLIDVLGWSAHEVADSLATSVEAVNSALQRARATLAARDLGPPRAPLSEVERHTVERYCVAFEQHDIEALTALLHQEAVLSMPPYSLWWRGPEAIRAWWLSAPASGCEGSRLLPTQACGQPAFAHYRRGAEGSLQAWALMLVEVSHDRVSSVISFLDVAAVFPRFGFPARLPGP
ncbi:MAG: ECF-family polymerase sigma factor [Myxococcaceae bacterium]|nr:ECF-family polymerase sigma factor [Myxococcaceae bacterium]